VIWKFDQLTLSPSPPQENVLSESVAMVHDTYQRLKAAVKDLEEFMVSAAVAPRHPRRLHSHLP
jgi:hypothetical protein